MGIDEINILTAASNQEALEIARRELPGLIVADSKLGETTGYDFCRQVRETEDLKQIPVWIMTGPFERLDDQKYDSCGAEGHIRKPFDTQRLIDKVLTMSAPPDEEKARPSYPAAVAPSQPQIQMPRAVQSPVASMGSQPAIKPPMKPPTPPAIHIGPKPVAVGQQPGKGVSTTLHGPFHSATGEPVKPKRQPTMIGTPFVPPTRPSAASQPAAEVKPVAAVPPAAAPAKPATEEPMPRPRIAAAAETPEELFSKEAHRAFLDSLSPKQVEQLMGLIKDVVEKVAWEVVPDMAESIIKEELGRLLKEH
jgi:CheY-like chemotaxis protein